MTARRVSLVQAFKDWRSDLGVLSEEGLLALLEDAEQRAKDLEALIHSVEVVVPYVAAALGLGNTFPVKEEPDWIGVHGGRAGSSVRQLEHLLRMARASRRNV